MFCIPNKTKAVGSELVTSALQFRVWKQNRMNVPWWAAFSPVAEMKMVAQQVGPRCVAGPVLRCVIYLPGFSCSSQVGTGRRYKYASCFTDVETGPQKAEVGFELRSAFWALTDQASVSSPWFAGVAQQEVKWNKSQGLGSWFYSGPPSCETGPFIWGHFEPPYLTLSSGDNTTCSIYLTECGEGLQQD